MASLRPILFLTGSLFLLASTAGRAGQPFAEDKRLPRSQESRHLPEGALLRLGPERPRSGDGVVALAPAPDGQALVSAHRDGCLRIWDLAAGTERRRFRNQVGLCSSL